MYRFFSLIALLAILIQASLTFGMPFVDSLLIQKKMESLAENRRQHSDEQLRIELRQYLVEKGVNIAEAELLIRTQKGRTWIAAHYQVTRRMWFYETTFDFFPASDPEASLRTAVLERRGRAAPAGVD